MSVVWSLAKENSLKCFSHNPSPHNYWYPPDWSDSDPPNMGKRQMSLFSFLSQAKCSRRVRYHPD